MVIALALLLSFERFLFRPSGV